ncbi:terpene cyclase/mutase family protein [bacterium]|nr:terpene cyclase/mutase family protein [bacterium]
MMRLPNLLVAVTLATTAVAADLPSKTDESLLKEVARSQERAVQWLVGKQLPDGSWNQHPGITGLAVTALLRSGRELTAEQKEAVGRGLKYILAAVKPTGAIYGGGDTDKYPNYSTAICTVALVASGDPQHIETIRNARRFLLGSQFDAGENKEPDDPSYGGIGYGRRERPDLSNMHWALEAIRLTESLQTRADDSPHQEGTLHWQKAVQFLQRCQNLPGHNDQQWAKNAADRDLGGFVYMPGVSMANEDTGIPDPKQPLRSYGSMSYAGLKSYIYAELKKDDPRVVAAINWLKQNYTVDENPGLGAQGLYYYYQTFAKALTAYGDDTFTDSAGRVHDWRYELLRKLVTLQKAEGFWQNENNRWFENDPVLCTTYCVAIVGILQKRQYP